ncbi:MAG: cytochrome b/b6 domain-containing protein, partial [Nitrospirota bacterium]
MAQPARTRAMIRVWDPFVRLFHWTLAPAVVIAFLTQDERLSWHVSAGYLVLGLVLLRIIWGLVGARHARFGDFLFSPLTVLAYLKNLLFFRAERYLGHGPAGGAMVIALLLSLLLTTLSGLVLYGGQEYAGPLWPLMAAADDRWAEAVEEAHEFCAGLTLLLVALHVAGVFFSSAAHRENLIASMITGDKRRDVARPRAVSRPLVTRVIMLAAVTALSAPPASAFAGAVDDLLARYRSTGAATFSA